MVGIFSAESSQPLQGSAVTPKQAPEMPKNMLLGMLAGAVGVGADIFKHQQSLDAAQAIRDKKTAADAAKNKVISGVSVRYSNIVQAQMSGGMTDRQAYLEMNKIWQDANLKYSEYGQDLAELHAQAMGNGFAAREFDKLDFSEKLFQQQANAAKDFIPVGATREQQEEGIKKWQAQQAYLEMMKNSSSEVALYNQQLKTQGILTSNERARLALKKEKAEKDSRDALLGWLSGGYDSVVTQAENIRAGVIDGDPKSIAEAKIALDTLKRNTQNDILKIAPDGNFSRQTSELLGILDTYKEIIGNGHITKEMNEQLSAQKTKALFTLNSKMSDEARMYVYASNLLPGFTEVANKGSKSLVETIESISGVYNKGRLDNALSDKPEDIAKNKAAFNTTTEGTLNVLDNPYTPPNQRAAAIKEGKLLMDNMLKSIVDQSKSGSVSYQAIEPYALFYASPNGKRWLEEVKVDPATKDAFATVIQKYYLNRVQTTLSRSWKNAEPSSSVGNSMMQLPADANNFGIKDSYKVSFNGSSIVLEPKSGVDRQSLINHADNAAKFQSTLNTYANLWANIQGMSMKDVYENIVQPTVFGVKPEETKNAP